MNSAPRASGEKFIQVLTAYENPTKSKEISVEDVQKIVDANEKLVKEL